MRYSIRQQNRFVLCAAMAGCWLACAGIGRAAPMPPVHDRPFPDVPPNHWAYSAVEELRKLGILQGYPSEPPASTRKAAPKRAPAPWKPSSQKVDVGWSYR